MPNLKPGVLTLAIDPEPVLADMIAKVDALQDFMLVPIALAGADLTLRAVKVILALHERGGAEYSLGVTAVTVRAEDWADFASSIGCSERTATGAVRDAKRAKLLDVKYLDNGDRVFYVGTGEDETTQKPSKTCRTGTR
jgi:hypothetical protein